MYEPKKQPKHNFIDSVVVDFIKTHFGDTSFNGRIVIGMKGEYKLGTYMKTISCVDISSLPDYISKMHISKFRDYYITANTITNTSRRMSSLFSLNNIVIDLDNHHGHCKNNRLNDLIHAMMSELFLDRVIPMPNSIVYTGRGIQLWWAIIPAHKSLLDGYNKIKDNWIQHIQAFLASHSEFRGFNVDCAATRNAVGYFRLPCTYNTKTYECGRITIYHNTPTDIQKELDSLYTVDLTNIIKREKRKNFSRNSAQFAGLQRMRQIELLYNLRNPPAGNEQRDIFIFHMYNACKFAQLSEKDTWNKIQAFNSNFKKPLSEQELKNVICSAKRKDRGYKYKNSTLIMTLSITEAEQAAIGMNSAVKHTPKKKNNFKRDKLRREKKLNRNRRVIAMFKKGNSKSSIARKTGISRNTVLKIIRIYQAWIAAGKPRQYKTPTKKQIDEILKHLYMWDKLFKFTGCSKMDSLICLLHTPPPRVRR